MEWWTPLAVLLFPLVFLLVSAAVFRFMAGTVGARLEPWSPEVRGERRKTGPWWSQPGMWLLVAAAVALLLLVFAPRGLPGAVIVLPFFWMGRWRLRRAQGPACGSCGTPLHPEHEACPRCGTPVGG